MWLKSNSARIIAGFVGGLVAGAWMTAVDPSAAARVVPTVSLVGEAWLHALQMPLIPLILALIVTGVCSAVSAANAGSLAGRLLLFFAAMLLAATVFAAAVLTGMLALLPVPETARHGIQAALSIAPATGATQIGLFDWLAGIIPANPVEAAANGNMIQFVFFAIVLALAIAKIEPGARRNLHQFFDALAKAMMVLIHWALLAGPVGVFALAFVVGARAGVGAAGGLAHYIAMMVVMNILIGLFSYPLAVFGGRVSLPKFVRAALPPQAVAASTQSSLASLPAMVEACEGPLGISPRVVGIALPLAVATFRITSPSMNLAIAIYCAHIFGVPLAITNIAAGAGVAMLLTLASAGLPGQGNFLITTTPICLVMGVPITALPLLMAVETIPDIFRTVSTVTMDMSVTALVSARWRAPAASDAGATLMTEEQPRMPEE